MLLFYLILQLKLTVHCAKKALDYQYEKTDLRLQSIIGQSLLCFIQKCCLYIFSSRNISKPHNLFYFQILLEQQGKGMLTYCTSWHIYCPSGWERGVSFLVVCLAPRLFLILICCHCNVLSLIWCWRSITIVVWGSVNHDSI